MRKMIFVPLLLSASLPCSRLFAADKPSPVQTELCMLYTQRCSGKVQRFQQKINKIQAEIARGATVYSPAEIDKLEKKLRAAEEQMDELLGSSTPSKK